MSKYAIAGYEPEVDNDRVSQIVTSYLFVWKGQRTPLNRLGSSRPRPIRVFSLSFSDGWQVRNIHSSTGLSWNVSRK